MAINRTPERSTVFLSMNQAKGKRKNFQSKVSKSTEVQFEDNVLMRFRYPNVTGCALACGNNSACRSFSYCDSLMCQLYRDNLFLTGNEEAFFKVSTRCTYFAMKKNYSPTCSTDNSISQRHCGITTRRLGGIVENAKIDCDC